MPPKKSFEGFRRAGCLQKKVLKPSDAPDGSKKKFWRYPTEKMAPKRFLGTSRRHNYPQKKVGMVYRLQTWRQKKIWNIADEKDDSKFFSEHDYWMAGGG
jgi:hypothetical protein